MPAVVRIGSLEYDVLTDADSLLQAEEEMGKRLYGMSEGASQRIVLRPGMAPGFTRQIMLHEIVHQLFDDSGLQLDAETEEQICQSVQAPLLGVFRDNPELVAWLTAPD